jgi:hypothetical protein
MSMLGKVCIGHKAPDFHCEAVMKGNIEGSSLLLTALTVGLSSTCTLQQR